MLQTFLQSAWAMLAESAPGLLFGLLIAGVLHGLFPEKWVERWLSRPGLISILSASAFGLPLSLCSCSVIPVAITLRRKGASAGAMAAFLVSTPEIGVDSFFLSYSLLSLPFALIRMFAAFLTAIAVGLTVEFVTSKALPMQISREAPMSCCGCEPKQESSSLKRASILEWIRYGFVVLVDDLAFLLLLGFIIGGVITAFVPPDSISALGLSPLGQMLAMLFISLPTYVCAATSTPVAAALISKGLVPGAALVFLLAGPATNVSTILATAKEFGRKGCVAYSLCIAVMTMLAGVTVERIGIFGGDFAGATQHDHGSSLHMVSGVILLALLGGSCLRKFSNFRRRRNHGP